MAKITLGKRPENFKKTVTAILLDGTKGSVECVFKYRTTTEFGDLLDQQRGGETIEVENPDSMKAFFERNQAKNGAYFIEILDGWNLDDELNAKTAQQLCDQFPGVRDAIVEAYRLAIVEGRLGN